MTKYTDSNADPENDAEPNDDTIAGNTNIHGRIAYYTGDEDLSSNWSITEQWVRDTSSTVIA